MSNTKTLKRGDFLFKDGDKITSVYLIQSGTIAQCVVRPKKNVEIFQLGASHIVGEAVMLGQGNHLISGQATADTQVLEIPLDALKQQYEAAPQMIKLILKSLAERNRLALGELKSLKMDKDSMPCPDDQVAKVFGSIYHTFNHKGEKDKNGRYTIEWSMLRQYAQRIFGESLKRLEQAMNILVKLGMASYEKGKSPDNPDGPDEIQKATLFDLKPVENFAEFFAYHYFRNGRTDLLRVEDTYYYLLMGLVKLSEELEPDRFGVVSLEYTKFLNYCKEELEINLSNTHFSRFEQKGVMMKRRALSDGQVLLQFEKNEYKYMLASWMFLREIDKWNEKGIVDPAEKEEPRKAKKNVEASGGEPTVPCPSCSVPMPASAKFCSACGSKMNAAA